MRNVLVIQNSDKKLERLNESIENGVEKYTLGGVFTEINIRNRNERLYTEEGFLPAMNEMKQRMNDLGVIYGEFDHPDVFDTSLQRASHIIKSIDYVAEKKVVEGSIQLLSTYWGKEAKAIVNDGHPLFVSSRAAGITEGNGEVKLKKLFTYDIVADPGFGSAKMSSINESCGYSNESNFRIYEMSDESKINDLFNMNTNDLVTREQLSEYSVYLGEELKKTRGQVNEAVKLGKLDSKKMEELVAYYEGVREDYEKLTQYLDYLAEKMQVVVNENKSLKETQSKLIEHNDYLAENLEKTINYSEYIAENLDKNIAYSEYIAENLDSNIAYSEYIAENLDKNIAYSEYIAENLDKNIAYSEYIAENLDSNIAYSEYIAEHLDDNIAYSDYLAESLDKSISYQELISEKLNSNKLFESHEEEDFVIPTPSEFGFEMIEDEDGDVEVDITMDVDADELLDAEGAEELFVDGEGENCRVVCDDDNVDAEESLEDEVAELSDEVDALEDEVLSMEDTPDTEVDAVLEEEEEEVKEEEECSTENKEEDCEEEEEVIEEGEDCEDCLEEDETDLDSKIDKLIEEAKKRKASETNEHHFLKFLNKSQYNSFYELDQEDQEKVVAHINERGNYMSDSDVLRLMQEALSVKAETLEEKLVRLMPNQIKAKWEKIDEGKKVSVLSQARLYPELSSEQQIENFWFTRNIKVDEPTKTLISENKYIQEDKLSDDAMKGIMERFNNLK